MAKNITRVTDTTAVNAAITATEGRATQRLLEARDLQRAAREAEAMLDSMSIRQADRLGLVVRQSGSVSLPNSYGGGAEATWIEITRARDGWRLTSTERTWNDAGGSRDWFFTVLPTAESILNGATKHLRAGKTG
ncbi:hypothetical protein [Microbacterium sp. A84]|uniref:hypothetical protein n=1 Tax=Microbacterium sp. A84 TaxID=3450715 RepID=UPI003F4262E8